MFHKHHVKSYIKVNKDMSKKYVSTIKEGLLLSITCIYIHMLYIVLSSKFHL